VFVAANILVIHPDVPAKTLPELVALARAQPGRLTYGHAGTGTSQHLAAELFKFMAHLDIQPVAYRGTTAILPDLLGGRLTMAFGNLVNVLPLMRDGKLRGFAVTLDQAFGRGARPADHGRIRLSRVRSRAVVRADGAGRHAARDHRQASPRDREGPGHAGRPQASGRARLDLIGGSPEEFAAVIKAETPQWAKVIREAGIRASE